MRNFFVGDPYFNDVVLCMPLRSSLRDESKYRRAVGVSGNTVVVNDAAYFDGNGDYLSLSDDLAAFELGGGDFTLEARIKPTGYSAGYSGQYKSSIFSRDVLNNRAFVLNLTGTASSWTGLELTLFADNTTGYTGHSASYTFALNQQYHIAAMRRSGVVTLYVNGVPILTEANTRVIQNIAIAYLIGRTEYPGYEYYFPGYIRDLRLTKAARYALNFTPPTSLPTHGVAALNRRVPVALSEAKRPPLLARRTEFGGDPHFNNVSLQLPLRYSNTLTQQIPARTITPTGTMLSQARAVYFDGASDWILTDTSADFNPAGTWTCEGWYFAVTVTSAPYILSAYQNASTRWAIQVGTDRISGVLFVANATGNSYTLDLSNQTETGWQHLAVCRNGQTGITTVFHNGAIVYRGTPSPDFGNASGRLELGAAAFNNSNSLNGYLLDVRYTKGIERYTSNFTLSKVFGLNDGYDHPIFGNPIEYRLPAHGVPNLTLRIPTYMKSESARAPILARRTAQGGDPYFNNVVLQLPLRSHLRDESKAPKAVTVNGDTKIVNDAAYFDTTGDYLRLNGESDFAFGTGDFTVEFWIKPLDIGSLGIYYDSRPTSTNGAYLTIYPGGAQQQIVVFVSTAARITGTSPIVLGTWYHIAVSRSAGVTRLFINGNQEGGNWADSTNYLNGASRPTIIAAGDNTAVSGSAYLKDYRVTKGVARYTSNFTPPTSLPTHGVPSAAIALAAPASPVSSALSAIYQDALLQWAMAGTVYREASANWNALTAALRAAQADWHLVNAAQRDVVSSWDMAGLVLREAVLSWDSDGGVAHSATLSWHELSTAQRDAVAQWIITISVDRPASLQWLLLTSAQRSAAMRWALLKAVSRDAQFDWRTIEAVFRDAGVDWSMLEPFIHEGHIDWNLANSAEAQAELAWALVQAAERDAEVRFNLATAAFADAETAWNILSAAVRDMTARWDLIGAVLRSMDTTWNVVMGVSRDSEAAWNVAIAATQQLEAQWSALGIAAKDAVIQWEKVGYTDQGIEVAWKIIPLYGTDGPSEYTVLITAEDRTVPIDFESRTRGVPAEPRTLIVPPAEDDTYGKL